MDANELFSVEVSIENFGEDVVGHGPPFSDEEYKTIRYAEAQRDSEKLKKYYTVNTFEAQLTCAAIYEVWGAKYRLLAIFHYKACIALLGTEENQSAEIYKSLGGLYEKCREFSLAIEAYQNALRLQPQYPGAYLKIATCFRKDNQLQSGIDFLELVKQSKYYLSPIPNTNFRSCIDAELQDLYKKKSKGYVFRPKKETFEYYTYSDSIDKICSSYLQQWK